MEEGRGSQQSTKDNADGSSLGHLVPNSAFCSRKEPAALLLLRYKGADKGREVEGGARRRRHALSDHYPTRDYGFMQLPPQGVLYYPWERVLRLTHTPQRRSLGIFSIAARRVKNVR